MLLTWPSGSGGIAAGMTFFAPLTTSLVPARAAGSATPTFTRTTAATVTDWEGTVRAVLPGEARFQGARRVQNLLAGTGKSSEVFSNWAANAGVAVTAGVADPFGGMTASTVTATAPTGQCVTTLSTLVVGWQIRNTIWVRRRAGTSTVYFFNGNNAYPPITITSAWQRIDVGVTTALTTSGYIGFVFSATGDAIDVAAAMSENVTGQSNQNPGEYVSVGVLAAPYRGAGVDGVQYFSYQNGNTVSGNVVTSGTGPAISSSTSKWAYSPGTSSNYFSSPDAPANRITGDIDVSWFGVAPWQTGQGSLASKFKIGTGKSWGLNIGLGKLVMYASADGANDFSASCSANTPFADNTFGGVRITRVASTGVVTFYSAPYFGAAWAQVGTTATLLAGSNLFNAPCNLNITGSGDGASGQIASRCSRFQLFAGIGGTLAVDFNPSDSTGGGWTSKATGEVWAVNGAVAIFSGTNLWDSVSPLGYLVEEVRTNNCLSSADQSNATNWSALNSSIAGNAAVSPDGTAAAAQVAESAANAEHGVVQQTLTTTASPFTVSVYAKQYGTTRPWFRVRMDDGTASNGAQANFNLGTGALGQAAAKVGTYVTPSSSVTALGNGWYRCQLTVTPSAVSTTRIIFYSMDSDYSTASFSGNTGHAGDTAAGFFSWGAQVESGAFAASYIPTLTTSAARNSDVLTFSLAGNIANAAGALAAEFQPAFYITALDLRRVVGEGNIAGAAALIQVQSGLNGQISYYDGVNINASGMGSGSGVQKGVTLWSGLSAKCAVNGAVGSPGTYGGAFLTSSIGVGIGGNLPMNGTIRNVRAWQRALTDSQVTAL